MSASFAFLMYTFMGLPLLAFVSLTLAGARLTRRICRPVMVFAGLVQMASAVISQLLLLQFNKTSVDFSEFWDMSASAAAGFFRVDTFSLVALFCVGLVTAVAFLLKWFDSERDLFNFTGLSLLLMLGMNGVALASDLFTLYVFMEASALACYTMNALYHGDERGLEGGFKQLTMGALASALVLVGLAFIFMQSGSLRYDDLTVFFAADAPIPLLNYLAFIFLLAGLALKSGLVPFHQWLPDAYESAPGPVAVIFGGAATQMIGVYALIRLMNGLLKGGSMPTVNTALLVLGLLTILIGALGALEQKDMKRSLAYSSLSQIGYITLGLSCGNIFGFVGAVMHFFNLSLANTVLFVNAASVSYVVGTTDMDKLGGLQKQMPITGTTNVIAFLSNAGVPPTAGFWSKLLIIIAVWQTGSGFIAGLALFSCVLTAACFLRMQRKVFFGPEILQLSGLSEPRGGFAVSSIVLSLLILLLGLLMPFLLRLLQTQGLL